MLRHAVATVTALLLAMVLLSGFGVLHAQEPREDVENMPPKNELTDEDKAKLEELKAKMEPVKAKIAEESAKLKATETELSGMEKQRGAASMKVSALQGLLTKRAFILKNARDSKKADKADKKNLDGKTPKQALAEMESLMKEVGFGGKEEKAAEEIAKQMALKEPLMERMQLDPKDRDTERKVSKIDDKIADAQKVLTKAGKDYIDDAAKGYDRLKRQEDKIKEELREAEGKLRELRADYGKISGNQLAGDLPGVDSSFDADELLKKSEDVAGSAWIDEETRLVSALSNSNFDDLASAYLDEIKTMKNPDGSSLTEDQKNYLAKAAAQMKVQRVFRVADMAEKLKIADETLRLYQQAADSLPKGSVLHLDAETEMAGVYIRIADHVGDTAKRERNRLGSNWTPAVSFGGEAATGGPSGDIRTIALPIAPPLSVPGEEALAAMETAEAERAVNDAALAMAEKWYKVGTARANFTFETLYTIYEDAIWAYQDAMEAGDKGKMEQIYKLLMVFGPRKVKVQHYIEEGYANWPDLYPESMYKTKKEIASKGLSFVDTNSEDYNSVWPHDKLAWAYYIGMLGNQPDPLFKLDWDFKPEPRVVPIPTDEGLTKEEIAWEEKNLERWRYPSDKLQKLFEWHFAENRNPNTPDGHKERGVYYYAWGLANSAILHYELSEAVMTEPEPVKKKVELEEGEVARPEAPTIPRSEKQQRLRAHADELRLKAQAALDMVVQPSTPAGTLSDGTRFTAHLKLRIPWYLYFAEKAMKEGDTTTATAMAKKALGEAATVMASAPPAWKLNAQNYMLSVIGFAQRLKIPGVGGGGSGLEGDPVLVLNDAEKLLRAGYDADREGDREKAKDLFYDSMTHYLVALDSLKHTAGKGARDNILPKSLFNLGIAAIKAEDYETAYVANWEVVQEFRDDQAHYPFERYPGAAKYLEKAARHLQFAAHRLMNTTGERRHQEMYLDALMLKTANVAGKGDEIPALIDTAVKMKQYQRAIEFIDRVDRENPFFALVQLMAADIYQKMMKQDFARLERIKEDLKTTYVNEDGEEVEKPAEEQLPEEERAALEAKVPELEASIKDYADKALAYSNRFLTAHAENQKKWEAEKMRGLPVPERLEKIRRQERKNKLSAMLIPIAILIGQEQWTEAGTRCAEFVQAVQADASIDSEKTRNASLAQGYWLWLVSEYNQADPKLDPIPEAKQALEKAAGLRAKLAEIAAKVESEKVDGYITDSAMLLGGGYLALATRTGRQVDKVTAEGGDASALQKQEDALRLEAVDWFGQAEEVIYKQIALGVQMGQTLTKQGLYQRAEEVLAKVIDFWGYSLFTPQSTLRGSVKPAQFASAPVDEAVKADLAGVLPYGELQGAAGGGLEALATKFNEVVKGLQYADHAPAIQKALESAKAVYEEKAKDRSQKSAGAILKNIEQAQRLAQGLEGVKPGEREEARQRLNRILLEISWPDHVFRAPTVDMLPTKESFIDAQASADEGMRTDEELAKSAVLQAMMDPEPIKLKSAGRTARKMKAEIEAAIAASDDEDRKQTLTLYKQALDRPLTVYLFGEINDKGKLKGRSYGKAAQHVQVMQKYNKDEAPKGKVTPREVEGIQPFLRRLKNATIQQNTLLYAKKAYVRAMVETGKYKEAETYVQQLVEILPDDPGLKLDLARVYTAMGAYEEMGKFRPFGPEGAKYFFEARAQTAEVIKRSNATMDIYWRAWAENFNNQVTEVEVRKETNPTATPEVVLQYTKKDGSVGTYKRSPKDLKEFGDDTSKTIARMLEQQNPEPPEFFVEEVTALQKRLTKAGFPPPKKVKLDLQISKMPEKKDEDKAEEAAGKAEAGGETTPADQPADEAEQEGDAEDADGTTDPAAEALADDAAEPAATE